ncbi:DUF4912 domain-containing protein [bacterium]|nr:MAG: DUF4912 domain-containing protein [bacterium]
MVKLRKKKVNSKKLVRIKKTTASVKPAVRKIKKRSVPLKTKKKSYAAQEIMVEQAKFYTGQVSHIAPQPVSRELPFEYGRDRMILQVRDTHWVHVYWELTNQTLDKFRKELGKDFYTTRRALRVYDISQINFNGNNAHRFFDIQINEYANNWYIDTDGPGRSWCVDLGLLLADGRFITILRSNTVQSPSDGPSWITDEEWMIPEDMFVRLYGMGFGFGQSSAVDKKGWQQKLRKELFSGVLASPGIASMASPVKKPGVRKFWLTVNTELIVYGATEPDAQVSVQGRSIKLRPDGTFTLRFALPEGKQVIPVQARSSDQKEERTITPIVTKETK